MMSLAGFGSLSDEDYLEHYWKPFRAILEVIFAPPAGNTRRISYEETYTLVYKCVCSRSGERLFQDLLFYLQALFAGWYEELKALRDEPARFTFRFYEILERHFTALNTLIPVCHYLNKNYVEPKTFASLEECVNQLLQAELKADVVETFVGQLSSARGVAFAVAPEVMQKSVQHLYRLNHALIALDRELFSAYLTNVAPTMLESDLETQIEADRALQARLRAQTRPSTGADIQGQKRSFDDEVGLPI